MKPVKDTNARDLDVEGELLWSIKTVVKKTGLSPASIYRYTARNLFPAQRRIGPGRVAWLAAEVFAWIESRPSPSVRAEPSIRRTTKRRS